MSEAFEYPDSVLDEATSVIFCLDRDLRITYCNPAWDTFAKENGGERFCRPMPIGRSILDCISGPDRDYYERQYKRVLAQSEPWEIDYHCSSASEYRRFRLRVVPMRKKPGLMVINSLCVEHPQHLPPCPAENELYRNPDGIIVMCGSCRRTRRNAPGTDKWDWVPDFVKNLPPNVSHGLCAECLELYRSYAR